MVQRCGGHPCPAGGCNDHESEDAVYRSATGSPARDMDSALAMARTTGRSLPGEVAEAMGARLGHDFSQVRIHDDAQAAASAAHYAADAYTLGSHIVFGAGHYQPGSQAGQRLLAHELTHVIQARNGGGGATGVSSPSDASEQEASRVAATALGGAEVRVGAAAAQGIQRQAGDGSQQGAKPAAVPAEKWSKTLEDAYRKQGDEKRATAIRLCRENGGRSCNLVLTQSEMSALYAASKQDRGDEKKVRTDAFRILPVLGFVAAGAGAAAGTTTGTAAGGGTVAGAAGAAAGPLAIVAVCVIAGVQLWLLGQFQQELESKGFIILDDPLAVCIKGCHTSPVPLPKSRPIPEFDRDLPMDKDTIKKWLDAEKKPAPATEEKPGPRPAAPRLPDPDVDDEERKGCRGTAGPPLGGNTCHDQFATSVSGVPREWVVTTPEGIVESYDARSRDGGMLYEMKTGYGFLGIQHPTPAQRTMITRTAERWQRQSAAQQVVASKCGYQLTWYFTNEAARAFADGIIQPRTVRVPFRCDVDGERAR
jgi:hypothetical protein